MTQKNHLIWLLLGGFLFFVDQALKHFFFTHQNFSFFFARPNFGFEYFENPGIAFGIPVPGWIILFFTPIILLFLLLQVVKPHKELQTVRIIFFSFLFFGALSNFIDRIFFEFTRDYIRIFTSILNIADILIVIGVFGVLFNERTSKD